jgi:hypothetical protein
MSCDATSFRLECALRDANKHITTIEQKNFEKKLKKINQISSSKFCLKKL